MRRIFRDTTAIALGLGLTLPALASAQTLSAADAARVGAERAANMPELARMLDEEIGDGRARRYYRLTEDGTAVLHREALRMRQAAESRPMRPSTEIHGSRQRNIRTVSRTGSVSCIRTTTVSRSGVRISASVTATALAAASSLRSRMPRRRICSASAARSVSNSPHRSRRACTEAASAPSRVR